MNLSERIYVEEEHIDEAIAVLDAHFIENDLDDGDRIMLAEDDINDAAMFLEEAGIDFDII